MNNRQRGVSQDELSSIYQMHDQIQVIAGPDRAVEVAGPSLAVNLLPGECIHIRVGQHRQCVYLEQDACGF